MGTMRLFKVWLLIALMVLSDGSLSYAQTNTFPPDGNVGIGTTVPSEQLSLSTALSIHGINMTNTGVGGRAYVLINTSGTHPFGQGKFAIYDGNAGLARLIIDSDGNVGIGTTSPAALLHVAGNAVVDGNIGAKYQDVAEWVRTSTQLAPGTVVVIDPQENNQVLPASQAYDTRVAGVVSGQPGILLGEAGDDKAKVAHSGRVKVKADAQYGTIAVGDLLVTGGTPGYAMRSTPIEISGTPIHRPGTIVGKALEPLKEGQGEILVFLTLQ